MQPHGDPRPLDDVSFMRAALSEARLAADEAEVPVGAVVVHEGKIIGRAHNQRERLNDPTAHAEMIALTQAAGARETWRLDDCVLYVTLEPCLMCAGALVNSRISKVVFGAADQRAGACGSLYQVGLDRRLNHSFRIESGVLEKECAELLQVFFQARRKKA
jgi:tRNA(adenine34) deaminase